MNLHSDGHWECYSRKQYSGIEELLPLLRNTDEFASVSVLKNERMLKQTIQYVASYSKQIAGRDIKEKEFSDLLKDSRPFARAALLANKNCDAITVLGLLSDSSIAVALFAAENQKVSLLANGHSEIFNFSEELKELDPLVKKRLLRNKHCPAALYFDLVNSLELRYSLELANDTGLTKEVFEYLAHTEMTHIIQYLVKNEALPVELVRKFALHKDSNVRALVAGRKNIDNYTLGKLSLDLNVEVRAVASNRLQLLLGTIRLTDWCQVNLGVKSSRVTVLVEQAVKKYTSTGWLVVLADFLRRIFVSNTTEYLNMLERLVVKSVATNMSKHYEAFHHCPFLEESFRALPKEVIEAVLKGPIPKDLNDWCKERKSLGAYLPSFRDELREVLKKSSIRKMSDILEIVGKLIDEKTVEIKQQLNVPLPAVHRLAYLKNKKLKGELEDYYIHVPETLAELTEVGKAFRNCLAGRSIALSYSYKGNVAVLRYKKNHKNAFVFQVGASGSISELKGKAGTLPNASISNQLNKFVQEALPVMRRRSTERQGPNGRVANQQGIIRNRRVDHPGIPPGWLRDDLGE